MATPRSLLFLLLYSLPALPASDRGLGGAWGPRISPCSYPDPAAPAFHRLCHITQPSIRRYRICDPQAVISMTEAREIVVALDSLYLRKDDHCICEKDSSRICWYKFGFAFIRNFTFPDFSLPRPLAKDMCQANASEHLKKSFVYGLSDEQRAQEFGQHFADIVRERWSMGKCGEDILFLFVMQRPFALRSVSKEKGRPMIFVSVGKEVRSRAGAVTTEKVPSYLHLVQGLNVRLEHASEFRSVVLFLIEQYAAMLGKSDELHVRPKAREHVPLWAWMAFLGSSLLIVCMLIGVFTMRGGGRRGPSAAGKSGGGKDKKWKAGFVGGMFLRRNKGDDGNNDPNSNG